MVNRTVALIIRKTCQLWWFNWLIYGTEILLLAAPRGDYNYSEEKCKWSLFLFLIKCFSSTIQLKRTSSVLKRLMWIHLLKLLLTQNYIWEQTDLEVTNLAANSLLFTANIKGKILCAVWMKEWMNQAVSHEVWPFRFFWRACTWGVASLSPK